MISPELIAAMFNKACDVSIATVNSFDEEKYAKAIDIMCKSMSDEQIQNMIIMAILNDDEIDIESKIALCNQQMERYSEKEERKMRLQAELINEHERIRGKVVSDIVATVFSGGIYLILKGARNLIVSGYANRLSHRDNDNPLLDNSPNYNTMMDKQRDRER